MYNRTTIYNMHLTFMLLSHAMSMPLFYYSLYDSMILTICNFKTEEMFSHGAGVTRVFFTSQVT
jgi:hypothetical protein